MCPYLSLLLEKKQADHGQINSNLLRIFIVDEAGVGKSARGVPCPGLTAGVCLAWLAAELTAGFAKKGKICQNFYLNNIQNKM
jgi:hypothetical protein